MADKKVKALSIVLGMLFLTILAIQSYYFQQSKKAAKEKEVINALMKIVSMEIQWKKRHPYYANLSELGSARTAYISPDLSKGVKYGYGFSVTVSREGNNFFLTAIPVRGKGPSFYIDEDGVLCVSVKDTHIPVKCHYNKSCPLGYSGYK